MHHPRATGLSTAIRAITTVVACWFGVAAHAAFDPPNVDLANASSSTYGGGAINVSGQANAWFQSNNTQPAGTGVFNPFLRVQVTGSGTPKEASEQGYNTSYQNPHDVFDNKSPVNWTHDVRFSDLQSVTQGGIEYYQFKLDINEPGTSPDSLLSLDGLRLFSTNTPSQSSTGVLNKGVAGDWDWAASGQNTLLWDLDKGVSQGTSSDPNDRYILLDRNRNGGGSGIADMVVLFEKSAIDAARAAGNNGEYLILWSRFGLSNGAYDPGNNDTTADGGFEEWSFQSRVGSPNGGGGGGVPLPGTVALALLALGLMGRVGSRMPRLG